MYSNLSVRTPGEFRENWNPSISVRRFADSRTDTSQALLLVEPLSQMRDIFRIGQRS
jgi:hypothetical protein